MYSLRQKVTVTAVVLGMNLLVLLFFAPFLVFSLVPSVLFLVVVLTR